MRPDLLALVKDLRALAERVEAAAAVPESPFVTRRTSGLPPRTWDRMVKEGRLSVRRVGRAFVATREDVRSAVLGLPEKGHDPVKENLRDMLARAGIR